MRERSNHLAFASALLTTNLKAAAALRGAFVIQVVFMVLNNLTFFVFWWALMRRVPDLRGWRLGDIQVLFGIVAAGFGLTVTLAGSNLFWMMVFRQWTAPRRHRRAAPPR